jgi:HEAT repeat protein
MTLGALKLVITLILVLTSLQPYARKAISPAAMQDTEIEAFIHQLCSTDENVRHRAKAELAFAGLQAAPYIIALLNDLAAHSAQQFLKPKKDDGRLTYIDEATSKDPHGYVATWGVIWDCAELLGDMKSAESVPVLIQIMAQHTDISGKIKPEMKALIQIGEPAVEPLIDTIKNATAMVQAITADPERSASSPDLLSLRAAIVLGEIGDARALPVLEDLLKPGAPFEQGEVSIQSAIEKLKSKKITK